jgi:hypothetical protein
VGEYTPPREGFARLQIDSLPPHTFVQVEPIHSLPPGHFGQTSFVRSKHRSSHSISSKPLPEFWIIHVTTVSETCFSPASTCIGTLPYSRSRTRRTPPICRHASRSSSSSPLTFTLIRIKPKRWISPAFPSQQRSPRNSRRETPRSLYANQS